MTDGGVDTATTSGAVDDAAKAGGVGEAGSAGSCAGAVVLAAAEPATVVPVTRFAHAVASTIPATHQISQRDRRNVGTS